MTENRTFGVISCFVTETLKNIAIQFLTECWKYAGNTNDVEIQGYQAKEWNKFIFFTKYEKDLKYYRKIIYTNHNMDNGQELTRVYYDDLGSLKYITFCENTCLDDKGNRIHWTTGYYKNLRIWNGDIASPFEIEQYDQNFPSYINRISSIIYFFPLKNEYISNNKFVFL